MDQKILGQREKIAGKILNLAVSNRYVNCHSNRFSQNETMELFSLISAIKQKHAPPVVELNTLAFRRCREGELCQECEAELLRESINQVLTANGKPPLETSAISMPVILNRWSSVLESPALLIFHCFHDLYDDTEKNILRSVRQAHDYINSRLLGLLLFSTQPVSKWELLPESPLDDRHVALFEL